MALIATLAVAFALARLPLVWVVLDARRSGPLAAGLRYAWLCAGLALAASLIRSPSRRLSAYGWVLVGSLAIPLAFPRLDLGMEPDIPAYFNLATIGAASSLWLVAWIIGARTARDRREGSSTGAS